MSRPEDIPEDVWDTAEIALKFVPSGNDEAQIASIARAIMAAKAEERREIQTAVQDMIVPADTPNSWQLGYRQCRIDAVAAIRKRREA